MNDRNPTVVALDVSDRTAEVCVLDRSGVLDQFKIVLDEESLRTRVPFVAPDAGVVVIETGTRSAWLKRVLTGLGMRVVVADARKLKAVSASPTKTDRNDARVLAKLGLADELVNQAGASSERLLCDTWTRPPELQRIYERLAVRDQLVRRRGDFIREVRSAVKGTGRSLRRGTTTDSFHTLRGDVGEELGDVLDPLFDVIESCTKAIKSIEAKLEDVATAHPEVEWLRQVPGVGTITAFAFLAVIGDASRFSNIRNVGAYLGLVVRRDQSGRMDPALGISKCGNGLMRRLLVQCAAYILGPFGKDCQLRRWGLKYVAEKGEKSKKKARVAVARKLAVQMLGLWKNERTWQALPGPAAEAEVPSATVGCDDCAMPLVPLEHATSEIAASPTAPIQPCARPPRTRTDESAESRKGSRTAVKNGKPLETRARLAGRHLATADGDRGGPPPGDGVAPTPGPGTPCSASGSHGGPPGTTRRAARTPIGVGPQPPRAKIPALDKRGDPSS